MAYRVAAFRGAAASRATPRASGWATGGRSKSEKAAPSPRRQKGAKAKAPSTRQLETERHKYFDEAALRVRGGDGGDGVAFGASEGGRRAGGEEVALPRGAPGGNVVLYVDEKYDDLIHLRRKAEYKARGGACADRGALKGGPGGKAVPKDVALLRDTSRDVRVPVPPGTFVRTAGGQPLADLLRVGQSVVVATGGEGGHSYRRLSKEGAKKREIRQRRAEEASGVSAVFDEGDAAAEELKAGARGEERGLTLVLRVVADVGLVGLPNAGKSSLLAATTAAAPQVAPYPFTTLVPNLGILEAPAVEEETVAADSDDDDGFGDPMAFNPFATATAGGDPSLVTDAQLAVTEERPPVLADLPGLIEGAHVGKGLGRVFLRHLRRARVLLHVVDCASADPLGDYLAIRRELWLYNPQYCERPHVLALNKTDLPGVDEWAAALQAEIEAGSLEARLAEMAEEAALEAELEAEAKASGDEPSGDKSPSDKFAAAAPPPPFRVVRTSAAEGAGLTELRAALADALASLPADERRATAAAGRASGKTLAARSLERARAGGRRPKQQPKQRV